MLDDLRSLSQAFVQENKALARHNREGESSVIRISHLDLTLARGAV